MAVALLVCQALLTFVCEGEGPVRFGFPLPAEQLQRGLRVSGSKARLQWRALHDRPDPGTGRLWVELAVAGARGRVRVMAGGDGPVGDEGGAIVRVETQAESFSGCDIRRVRWLWCTGEVDELQRRTFTEMTEHAGEVFDAGASLTEMSPALLERCLRVRVAPGVWQRAGVLPRLGTLAREYRARLCEAAAELHELPGLRGRGDYGRSGDVVTNLEFDTALGFVRLGLATSSPKLLQRGLDSARHLADRDLHPRSGLPYRHGPGHRVVKPEPGHAWLTGVLLAGCVSADDGLIAAAGTIAHGLARHPPRGEDLSDRARDYGWPLHELEAWLRFSDDRICRRTADRLARNLAGRWDSRNGVLRFGEGERRRGFYEERAWITGGILVPALRRHLERRPDEDLAGVLEATEQRLLGLVLQGRPGLPVRYWVRDGEVTGQVRLRGVPEAYMLLEGIAPRALRRCLSRKVVRGALRDVPPEDDPNLATSFSIAARCSWVLR